MSIILKHICAWCQQELVKYKKSSKHDRISHGICETCAENFLNDSPQQLLDYLDDLHIPVLLVDQDGKIIRSNQNASKKIGKKIDQIVGYRGGEVFDCVHANLEGGCGHTIYCSDCTIRQSVNETYSTGNSIINRTAYLTVCREGISRREKILISTEKLGNLVLLKVESISE